MNNRGHDHGRMVEILTPGGQQPPFGNVGRCVNNRGHPQEDGGDPESEAVVAT